MRIVNGWRLGSENLGNYGSDYLFRALIALTGLAALVPEEATYLSWIGKKDAPRISGHNRYRLRFEADQLPPVNAFWSLTMYEIMPDKRLFLVDNPIRRYSIGGMTEGLKYNEDGSVDLYIQHTSPGPDHESNWLPAAQDRFSLVMRAYQPDPSIIRGEYRFPELQMLD